MSSYATDPSLCNNLSHLNTVDQINIQSDHSPALWIVKYSNIYLTSHGITTHAMITRIINII